MTEDTRLTAVTDSLRELLEGRRYAVLATHNEDGSIHLTPVWYLFEDGQLFVTTYSSSRKARNVAVRPNATVLVDTRELGSERWASASGRADLLTGDASKAIHDKIHRRYMTEEALRTPGVGPVMASMGDVAIRIRPEKWRSWDMKGFDAQFFGGVLTPAPERWFLPLD